MTEENIPFLRFSLEESIWFEKGQEVAELYSISLDPNVVIQESDQYVVIRGTLDLTGEYKKNTGESEIKHFSQGYYPKTIHTTETADGTQEFSHRFPVDISIPYHRVESIDEIEVNIQTFDYTLLERNCLKLQANLLITGIYGDTEPAVPEYAEQRNEEPEQAIYEAAEERDEEVTQEEEVQDEVIHEEAIQEEEVFSQREEETDRIIEPLVREAVEEIEITVEDTAQYKPFYVDVKKQADEEEEEPESRLDLPQLQIREEPPEVHHEEPEAVRQQAQDEELEIAQQRVQEEEPVIAQQQEPVISQQQVQHQEPESTWEPEEVIESKAVRAEAVNVSYTAEQIQQPEEEKEHEPQQRVPQSRIQERKKTQQQEKEEAREEAKEKRVSLMDYFGKKEEEESVRMKVCIVQSGDTLIGLSERYNVSVQSIQNSNELEPAKDLYEGQVLYIPIPAAYKH